MIFDVEADGLLNEATKIHVMAYKKGGEVKYTHSYDKMRELLLNAKVLIGHNIITYDIPLCEKILGIEIKGRTIDTLALSWYLNHNRVFHGLDSYGEFYGIEKPKVDDWHSLTKEEYAHRCVEDVKINFRLWQDLKSKLLRLYNTKEDADRLIDYLSFKMECIREQEKSGWKLDKKLAEETLSSLCSTRDELVEQLKKVMPPVKKYVKKSRPKKPFTKDGSYSVIGAKWFKLLRDNNLPKDYEGTVEVLHSTEEPNPNSSIQVKEWLFSLGWKPEYFKFDRDKVTGLERKIPQVRDKDKNLCKSVLKLADKYPEIKLLENLTVLNHRISIFEGFLKNEKDGWLVATAGGLTNTLRFKHRVLVNLPGVHVPYGKEIRGSLVAPDGWELCGADMVSLEETTKKHFMFPYDPDFVEEMSKEGFDAHLDLAKYAGVVTQKQIDRHVKVVEDLSPIRKIYKAANYACIYGVGAAKLARETGLTQRKAAKLIEVYWQRNWAVKKLSEDTKVKRIDGEMWLYNPVSKFYYSLRNEKDIFSTLNQGTGVYCFDSWLMEVLKRRKQLTAQFHDEGVWCVKKGNRDKMEKLNLFCTSIS